MSIKYIYKIAIYKYIKQAVNLQNLTLKTACHQYPFFLVVNFSQF
jgi:hypothetical protein